MEQNPSPPPPPPQRPQMDPSYQSNVQHGVSQMPNTEQHPRILAPKQTAPLTTPKPIPTTYPPKPPMTRANWVNAFWADISGQLRRLSVISGDLFDGLLLRRTTHTGSLILNELRQKYEQLGHDRDLASVRVLSPERVMGGVWRLWWTVKRQRDPNGRQFFDQTILDPINYKSYMEVESNPGYTFPGAEFSLPPFIQDFGPGPSEFDPEQENEFDAEVRGIISDVDNGLRIREV